MCGIDFFRKMSIFCKNIVLQSIKRYETIKKVENEIFYFFCDFLFFLTDRRTNGRFTATRFQRGLLFEISGPGRLGRLGPARDTRRGLTPFPASTSLVIAFARENKAQFRAELMLIR